MENNKSIKKRTVIVFILLSLVLSACASIIGSAISNENARNRNIDALLNDANHSVTEFSGDMAYNYFLFTDNLYSKANTIEMLADEELTTEELSAIARNQYLNSFAITDTDGKITVSYPEELKNTNMLDNKDLAQFKSNLKGIKFKSISTPVPVEGEEGRYTVMAAVTRPEGGIVIVDATVDNYYMVSGEQIADKCKGSTIIAKNDDIVSANIDTDGKSTLKELGINKSNLNGNVFALSIKDKQYTFKADTVNDYTVISGISNSESGIDNMYSIVTPIIANTVIFIIFAVVILMLDKRRKNN